MGPGLVPFLIKPHPEDSKTLYNVKLFPQDVYLPAGIDAPRDDGTDRVAITPRRWVEVLEVSAHDTRPNQRRSGVGASRARGIGSEMDGGCVMHSVEHESYEHGQTSCLAA